MVELPLTTWVSAGLVFLAVALGTVSLALTWEWWRDRQQQERALAQLRELASETASSEAARTIFRRPEQTETMVTELLARVPHIRDLQLLLEQAGSSWSVQTYLFLSLGLAVALGVGGLIGLQLWSGGAVCAAVGALLPYLLIRRRRAKRAAAFEERLPDTIDFLTRAIRAGHPLSAGFKMVADEAPEPVASEFRRAFEEQRFGLPMEDSLLSMADRVGLIDVRIMMTAILIQSTVGGNLAEILESLAYTIRERFKLRRQLRVYTAQGRLSGYILAVLPIAVGAAIFLLNPAYIMTLFTDPAGQFALGLALVLQLIGFLWIRRIINIEI